MKKLKLLFLFLIIIGSYSPLSAQFKKGESLFRGGLGFVANGVNISPNTSGRTEELRHYYSLNAGAGRFLNKNTALMLSGSFGRSRDRFITFSILKDTLANGTIVSQEQQKKDFYYTRDFNFAVGARRYFSIDKKILALLDGRINWNNRRARSIDDGYEKINYIYNTYLIAIDPGVCYLLNKRFGIEGFIEGFSLSYEPKSEYNSWGRFTSRFAGTGLLNVGLVYFPK